MTNPAINVQGLTNSLSGGRRKVGMIGDSITQVSDIFTPNLSQVSFGGSPVMFAMLASATGAWELITNAGVTGNKSDDVLNRIPSAIVALGCDICVIVTTTWNDVNAGYSAAKTANNIALQIQTLLRAGILPVICTPSPDGTTASNANRRAAQEINRRNIIELGRQYNIPVIDIFTPLGDMTSGLMKVAYNADGSFHPNAAGQQIMGATIAKVLDALCLGNTPQGVAYSGDPTDVLNGIGFFVTNAAGIGTGWTLAGGAGVASIVNDATLGNAQRITTNATGANTQLQTGATFAITQGHVYEIAGYLSKQGTSTVALAFNFNTGPQTNIQVTGASPDIVKGRFCFRSIPQAINVGNVYPVLIAGAGTGTVDLYKLTIRDLTALGIS